MAIANEPFYGCLCLETSSGPTKPLLDGDARKNLNIPLPEIHFNIWEEGTGTDPFLDIGVMLAVNDPAEQIEIFLPWKLEPNNIEDLCLRILAPNALSAIFNEAWTSSATSHNPGGYVTRTDGSIFTIVPYNLPKIEQRQHNSGILHSIVFNVAQLFSLSKATTETLTNQPEQMYIRIRVKNVPQKFYQVGIDQGDAFGGGTLNRTEIIDFRLNVRRGAPPAIESFLHGRFIKFSKVQLFLMKSRDQDIVFEDKLFKACRSLEDEKFWAGYILPTGATEATLEKSRKQVQWSLGYQWKKTVENNQPISEFGMLARFKSFKMRKGKLAFYIFLALCLGVLGNGTYDLLKWWVKANAVSLHREVKSSQKPESTHNLPPTAVKPNGNATTQNVGREEQK
jgi:hypothetical protein